MQFYKYQVINHLGNIIYQDFGFETEEDAEKAGIEYATSHHIKDWIVAVNQIWQELEYDEPTEVLFFDPELQEIHAGIAYAQDVICSECGGIFALDEVEIIREYTNWRNFEPAILGENYGLLEDYNTYAHQNSGIPRGLVIC